MSEFLNNNKKIIINISIIFFVILFSYIFFNYLFKYIAPFVIGWVISLIYNPIVDFLEKKFNIKRWLGTLITIVLIIGFLSSVVALVLSKLFTEAELFINRLPLYIENLKIIINEISYKIEETASNLPFGNIFDFNKSPIDFSNIITPIIKTGGSGSFNAVKAIPNFLMVVIMALISSYFFSKDKYEIKKFFKKHIPLSKNNHWIIVKQNLLNSLGGYFKTQIILMCYTFIICTIGFLIIKSPYGLLLSVVTSIIDALPFFGSGFILWPAIAISLFSGEYYLAVGYTIIYIIINIMRQIMQPKILGTQIGVHPLIALISMYIGLKIVGVLGMIIGPVVAVIIKAFFEASEICNNEK